MLLEIDDSDLMKNVQQCSKGQQKFLELDPPGALQTIIVTIISVLGLILCRRSKGARGPNLRPNLPHYSEILLGQYEYKTHY